MNEYEFTCLNNLMLGFHAFLSSNPSYLFTMSLFLRLLSIKRLRQSSHVFRRPRLNTTSETCAQRKQFWDVNFSSFNYLKNGKNYGGGGMYWLHNGVLHYHFCHDKYFMIYIRNTRRNACRSSVTIISVRF
jgi:hypothetical protein